VFEQLRNIDARHAPLCREGTERDIADTRVQSRHHVFLGVGEVGEHGDRMGESDLNLGGGAPEERQARIYPMHACIMTVARLARAQSSTRAAFTRRTDFLPEL